MSNAWSAQAGMISRSGDLLPLNILLHCRTVVESQNFVTTGLMTNVEGELFEVELSEFQAFELGEKVKLTVYTPAGIQSFPSMVFAKYEGAIALIQPPHLNNRFEEKREHPRVDVEGSLHIVHLFDSEGQAKPLHQPVEAALRNISVSGVGFMAPDFPELTRSAKLKANVALGFEFSCELEIVRRERQENGVIFGAIMRVLEPDKMRPLRALILRRQVERNVKTRKEIDVPQKQKFK